MENARSCCFEPAENRLVSLARELFALSLGTTLAGSALYCVFSGSLHLVAIVAGRF